MAEFTHNGVSYRLIPTSEWDFRDAAYGKQASGGMSVVQIERGVVEADGDALIGLLAVSIHRERDTAAAAKLRDEIEQGGARIVDTLLQIVGEAVGEVEEATDSRPPDGAAEAATLSPTPTTPEPFGVPA